MPVQLTCINCQKVFETKPYRAHIPYCGKDCRKEHLGKRVVLKCAHCGGPWETWVSQLKDANRQFCSMACRRAATPAKPKPPKVVREPVFKVCKTCSNTFRVPPTRKDSAKYCSKACAAESPEFRENASMLQRGSRSAMFKGGECESQAGYMTKKVWGRKFAINTFTHREVLTNALVAENADHPFLYERDGIKWLRPEIHVHHIDRNKLNNELDNLLAVTPGAHKRIHSNGKKPEPWECWPSNPSRW